MPMDLFSVPAAWSLWGSAGVALLGSLVLTPAVEWAARRLGAVDVPSDDRWASRNVALLGGVSIAAGMALGAVGGGAAAAWAWPVWVGALLMLGLGLVDDLAVLSSLGKLMGQVVAAALVLAAGLAFWRGGPAWVSIPLTFLWVIGVTNALNLIDGIDGLAGGVTVVAAGTLAVISGVLGHTALAAVMAAVAGACLGYLPYNAPPARIFMGDGGSLLLGYLLSVGALGIQGGGGPLVGPLVPVAVLAVPIADTTFVTITRLLRGQSVRKGGTDHVHHRLLKLGLSEGEAVALLCGLSAGAGGLALSALWVDAVLVWAVAALGLVALTVGGIYLATTGAYTTAAPAQALSQRAGALLRRYGGGASWKAVGGMLADLLLVGAALIMAVYLRHGGAPPPALAVLLPQALPLVIVTKLGVFYAAGLYQGIWSHAGTPEVVRMAVASGGASALVAAAFGAVTGRVPTALLLIDWGVATVLVGGVRFGFRALRQSVVAHQEGGVRVLLYGTGTEGMLALRSLRRWPTQSFVVVGLLDEAPARHGSRMQGVTVLGRGADLPRLCAEHDVEMVVVPAATSAQMRRRLQAQCREAGVPCRFFAATLQAPEAPPSPTLSPPPGDGAAPQSQQE